MVELVLKPRLSVSRAHAVNTCTRCLSKHWKGYHKRKKPSSSSWIWSYWLIHLPNALLNTLSLNNHYWQKAAFSVWGIQKNITNANNPHYLQISNLQIHIQLKFICNPQISIYELLHHVQACMGMPKGVIILVAFPPAFLSWGKIKRCLAIFLSSYKDDHWVEIKIWHLLLEWPRASNLTFLIYLLQQQWFSIC